MRSPSRCRCRCPNAEARGFASAATALEEDRRRKASGKVSDIADDRWLTRPRTLLPLPVGFDTFDDSSDDALFSFTLQGTSCPAFRRPPSCAPTPGSFGLGGWPEELAGSRTYDDPPTPLLQADQLEGERSSTRSR
jgi:hypothetical protein